MLKTATGSFGGARENITRETSPCETVQLKNKSCCLAKISGYCICSLWSFVYSMEHELNDIAMDRMPFSPAGTRHGDEQPNSISTHFIVYNNSLKYPTKHNLSMSFRRFCTDNLETSFSQKVFNKTHPKSPYTYTIHPDLIVSNS